MRNADQCTRSVYFLANVLLYSVSYDLNVSFGQRSLWNKNHCDVFILSCVQTMLVRMYYAAFV